MNSPAASSLPDTASGLLARSRSQRAVADRAEADLLRTAFEWAALHEAEHLDDAECYGRPGRFGGERGLPLAGPGAPLVAEFATAELAAALRLGPEAGKRYVGHALELAHRLPRLWASVQAGGLAAWRARRVAEQTISHALTPEAAAFVDAQVAAVAGRIGPAQLDRLVDEARGRFMPEAAEAERRRASDSRRFDIDHDQVSFAGTSYVSGELDLADALDLDDAIRGVAGQLADLGCAESLDVRRSLAAGELARRQLALDLAASEVEVRAQRASKPPVRKTVLYLHVSEVALTGGEGVGRCENTRSPVTAETIREWCGHPETDLVVKPVIDLADHVHTDAYEVPDRIKERIALRDHTCAFPWCTRPARRLEPDRHGCDADHVTPYDPGGPPGQTCSCRLAPLCRTHHRLKTHAGWTYTAIEPGTYLWRSPHGYRFVRDHTGTRDVSVDRRPSSRD
ncbi:DUF222 domain-containing protein [Nocardioides sp. GXQ0305]|uniref:HNH endonuclease signature motif containing protein n=1 Tax=Nocardioides sp. GXQ0305 TaxID=3423912 RepID=UPI003D7D4445